jgi:uncharacterized membrane protein YfcA
MALLVILLLVFAGVALMVFFGERYAKPMDEDQQRKYGKIMMILVFVLLISAMIKQFI